MGSSRLPGRPALTVEDAQILARDRFGMTCTATELPSDRDQNFRLIGQDGTSTVLKISNSNEIEAFLDCQTAVLRRLGSAGLPVPSVLQQSTAEFEGILHHVRLVSWLEGTPLGSVRPITRELAREVGKLLGKVDQALDGFHHEGAPTDFTWDLANAAQTIQSRLDLLPSAGRLLVENVLHQYEERRPIFAKLPMAVIHNDANDYNVLVEPPEPFHRKLRGLLDFGDVVYSARVGNICVAAAYLALHRSDPIEAICDAISGYTAVAPLSESELECVFMLVSTRLAISVCMSATQRAAEPDNDYLSITEKDAFKCLERLAGAHPRMATYRIRAAAGLDPLPASTRLSEWLEDRRGSFATVVQPAVQGIENVVLDFSVGSLEFDAEALTIPGLAEKLIWDRVGQAVGVGRWNEARLAYTGTQYATASGERRTVHLGVDLFRPAGTAVHAPLDGVVHSACINHERFDYGGCVILEHRPPEGSIFWTLYGHLSHTSAGAIRPGQEIKAGERFAELGPFEENGGWVPHLHFQIIADLLDMSGSYPGVAAPDVRPIWLKLCPSPAALLGLQDEADAPEPPTNSSLLERRNAHIGQALSLSYKRPLHLVRGLGTYLYDADGRAFLDAVNNVPHVGHSNPHVVKALHDQMRTLTTNTRYLHENILRYAEKLTNTLPDGLDVCFFVNSGSEANDLAIRLARSFTERQDILVLDGAYHGNLSTLIDLSPYKFDGPGGSGKPSGTHVVMMPDTYRGPYKGMTPEAGHLYAREVEIAVSHAKIAAFIAESVPGCGGQIVPPPEYLSRAAAAVRHSGGVFIADEVQVGMGRAGSHFWGFELDHVVPDIVVLGKPIGNGHPLGAVITTQAIADAFDNGMEYFNTFGGNPASCAVGLAVLNQIEEGHLQRNALEVGGRLKAGLASLAPQHPIIGDVRGVGLFIGVELVRNHVDLEPAAEEASYVANRMRDKGILISTDGPLHNVLKIKPPMVFSNDHADFLISTLDEILAEDYVAARLRT